MVRIGSALLVITALAQGGALAQTAATPQTTTAPVADASGATAGAMQFVTDQSTSEFRASKFVGLDVYGMDSQKIGDINEILFDGAGSAKTVVIGVGGFLGLGEKNVAVPFSALEWVNARPAATAAAPSGGMMNTAPPAARGEVTGSTNATPAAAQRSPAEEAAYNGYPDHAMIKLSKADLENAPTFKYYAETHSRSAGAGATPTAPAPKP